MSVRPSIENERAVACRYLRDLEASLMRLHAIEGFSRYVRDTAESLIRMCDEAVENSRLMTSGFELRGDLAASRAELQRQQTLREIRQSTQDHLARWS